MTNFQIFMVLVFWALHLYLTHKDKRKVDAIVHIQERTEEAETLDFAVTLFQDESRQDQLMKLDRFFTIAENRRQRNNEIVQAKFREMQENLKKQA